MKDKFEEFACEFKNEAECEEELEDYGLKLEDVEAKHFHDSSEDLNELQDEDLEEDLE